MTVTLPGAPPGPISYGASSWRCSRSCRSWSALAVAGDDSRSGRARVRQPAARRRLGVRDLGADLRRVPRLRGLPAAARASAAARSTGARGGGWRRRRCSTAAGCWRSGPRLVPLAELLIIGLLVSLAVVFGRSDPDARRAGMVERVVAARDRRPLRRLGLAWPRCWAPRPPACGSACPAPVRWPRSPRWSCCSRSTAIVALGGAVGHGDRGATPQRAVWALSGIALNDPPAGVVVAGAIAIVSVLAATARRISTAGNPTRAAWG